MGSSNRDYMQEDYEPRGSSWGHDIPTTKWLLIVTVVVFFLQTLTVHPPVLSGKTIHDSHIEEWFALESDRVLSGEVWRLVTFVFCHPRESPLYLVFNMLALYYLGSSLERMYGSREILWFYLASGLVCGLIFTAFGLKIDLPDPLMGAGSCVAALLTLYATHFPRQEILICWFFPMEIRFVVLIYAAIDVYVIFRAYSGQAPWVAVAYGSQIWGIAFGYLYRRMDWHLQGLVDFIDYRRIMRSIRLATSNRNLKVYQPEPLTNLDEQVDAILAKIHDHGSESLTDRERFILQKASEQAKNRH